MAVDVDRALAALFADVNLEASHKAARQKYGGGRVGTQDPAGVGATSPI